MKPKAKQSRQASDTAQAWSDGASSDASDAMKLTSQGGYRTGLHDGMRFVVNMMEDGASYAQIVDRCRARITSMIEKPSTEAASYWQAKQSVATGEAKPEPPA